MKWRKHPACDPPLHDGSLITLDDVVTFYFRGIPEPGVDGLTPDTFARFDLSFSDILAIVEFLKSMSGKVPEITPPTFP